MISPSDTAVFVFAKNMRDHFGHESERLARAISTPVFVVCDKNSTWWVPGFKATYELLAPQLEEDQLQDLSHMGTGLTKSLKYFLQETKFEYAWILESDVYISDHQAIRDLISHYSDKNFDLVGHDAFEDETADWSWWKSGRGLLPEPFYKARFNIFRISRKFTWTVFDWALKKNGGNFLFFELVFPTLLRHHKMSYDIMDAEKLRLHIRYRPCYLEPEIFDSGGGIFHPVKLRIGGGLRSCTGWKDGLN